MHQTNRKQQAEQAGERATRMPHCGKPNHEINRRDAEDAEIAQRWMIDLFGRLCRFCLLLNR